MKKTRWIDLSAQGIYLGSIKMADGVERLALLDMNNSVSPGRFKEIGFLPFEGSPRYDKGIYYMAGDQGLRPSRIAAAIGIEKCPLVDVVVGEIDTVFRARCLEKFQANLNAVTLRSEVLGQNAAGDYVYQTPAGRFVRTSKSEAVVERSAEGKALGKAMFLRADTNEELRLCAEGFVGKVMGGEKSSWDDLQKFGRVVFGKPQPSDGELHRLQEAVEAAAYRIFADRATLGGANERAFKMATDLYYGLPAARMRTSESVFLQQYSTPMPMSVVCQRLVMGKDDIRGKSFFEPTAGNGGLVNLIPEEARIFAMELDRKRLEALRENPRIHVEHGDATEAPLRARFGEPDGFDYTIANPPFGGMDEARSFDKLSAVRRLDHYIALRTLAARKDHGRSVLIFGADSAQSDGSVKGGAKPFLNYLFDHYEVHGCVELDGRMYSRHGAGYNVRLMVIGDKRPNPQHSEVPEKLPILTSYDELWGWSEKVISIFDAPRPAAEKVEPAKLGDRIRFTANDAGDRLSVGIVEGLVVDVASTSTGNTRYRVMTDVVAPQGGGNIEKLVYSHQGRVEVIPPQPVLDVDAVRVGVFDRAPMDVPDGWVVMNASRPLLGSRLNESNEFWPGRMFYAALDPADPHSARFAEENRKLDAAVVLVASREDQVGMALVGSEYRDRYYSEMDAEGRYEALRGQIRQLSELSYGNAKELLAQAQSHRASLSAVEVAPNTEMPDFPGFTKLPDGNVAANRAVFIPSLSVGDLESRLQKLIGDETDVERLKDYKWMMLFDQQTASDKGFMESYLADGGQVLVPRNKFWLSNIDERITAFGGDPQSLTNNPVVMDAQKHSSVATAEAIEPVEIDATAIADISAPAFTTATNPPAIVAVEPAAVREPWQMTSDEWSAARWAAKNSAAVVSGRSPGGAQAAAIGELARLSFDVTQWYHDRAKEGDKQALEWIQLPTVTHRDVIAKAVHEKRPVPNSVMAEYPDLAAPAPERRVNEFQTPYQPASKLGMPSSMVPINMAGATYAALNDLEGREGSVDGFVAGRLRYSTAELGDRFSPEQIDALALAIQAVESGRGIINADQTGMGKGRFVAGMMRYAKVQEKTPVFLTIKPELFTDIFRDIEDIGSRDLFKKLFIFNEGVHVMRFGTEDEILYRATSPQERRRIIDAKELDPDVDMVLATYSQFQRAASKNLKAQLLTSISQGRTMLFLDEAHVASGASNIAASVGEAVANCGGVVYSSATPLKGISNFSIYNKVFPASVDLKSLPDTLKTGGEALQEAISANMARDGVLIRREHDFSKLTFVTRLPEPAQQARNIELANKLSEVLSAMSYLSGDVSKMVGKQNKSFESDWEKIPESERQGQRMRASSMNFGSRLYALNRQFLLGIKIEDSVQASLDALQAGRKPVIAVENTGESLLRQVLSRRAGVDHLEKQLDELDERVGTLTDDEKRQREELQTAIGHALRTVRLDEPPQYRELLEIMLDRLGEIKVQGRYGDVHTERPSSEQYLETEARLREIIRDFPDLPLTPLDVVRHELGRRGFPVTEVSGRKASLAMEDNRWAASFHPKADAVASVAGFQCGKFDAIIITRSGSTGISLHATDRFEDSDTRQRDFIVLQKASNIAEFLQWLGRVNRKDQVIEPVITGLDSGLPAELRLTMMHNAKLRKLSANTTSNRENANTAGDEHDLLNEVGDAVALEWLLNNPDVADYLDIKLPSDEDDLMRFSQDCPYINKLLGRLMMCDVAKQQEILDTLNHNFGSKLEELEQQGINPFKVDVYEWGASVVKEEELQSGVLKPSGSTFDEAIKLVTVSFEQEVHPIRSEKLLGMIRAGEEHYRANAPIDEEGTLSPYKKVLRDMAEGALRRLLPAKLKDSEQSIGQILSTNDLPVVRLAKEKQDFLAQNLQYFRPGAFLTHSDLFKGDIGGVVTGVSFPNRREDVFLLSKYTMRVVFPGDDHPKDLSLATLFNQEQSLAATSYRSIDLEKMERFPYMRTQVENVLKQYNDVPDGRVKRSANLLQGNIFRACELASQQGLGAPILFSDAEGNRQRAVLLKSRITPEMVKAMPIGLDAADMVAYVNEYLRPDHKDFRSRTNYGALRILDCGLKEMKKGQGVMFEVLNGGQDFRLSIPGTKAKAGSLIVDGTIFDIGEKTAPGSLKLKLSGNKNYMSVDVPRDQLLEVMRRLQANNHVGKFYLPEPDQEVLKSLKERYAKDFGARATATHSNEPI